MISDDDSDSNPRQFPESLQNLLLNKSADILIINRIMQQRIDVLHENQRQIGSFPKMIQNFLEFRHFFDAFAHDSMEKMGSFLIFQRIIREMS